MNQLLVKKRTNDRIPQNGFTIIETMVAIAVFALIWTVTAAAITTFYRTQGYVMQQAMAINEARRGVDIMAKELRQARYGDNGAYPIEKAASKELIFYSDIDEDGQTERIRYFLATINSDSETKECYSNSQGGSCSVVFNNFLTGTMKLAQVRVSTEGYYGNPGRYSELYSDGVKLATLCQSDCSQCVGAWQGMQTFDITSAAVDNSIQFTLDSTSSVKAQCQWVNPNHSIKAVFEFSFTEEIPNVGNELRRGIVEPLGDPVTYPANQEQAEIITLYVRNLPPIFTYYDKNGDQITDDPSLLNDTKMVRLFMVVNVNPNRPPDDYDLEQYVQIRNLKEE